MPIRHVLIRDTGGHVKHDDTTLALDVVAVTEATKLLLTSGIPDVEADCAEVGGEGERVHFDTKGGCMVWRDQSLCKTSRFATRRFDLPMYFFSNSPVK